ncbi:MAG: prepilin-type N-terminal cleavage/methylation domain-containing protein, partial [Comamonas sp.]|nr:prepilin-type N-terminal cleavage/methylation domain-containing protein [Comamonas sp.]
MPRHLTRNTLPPTPGKALHPSQGLSLIEVLVAMSIALITFAAVGTII